MNVNTIITAQSFVNYTKAQIKCDNTAWAYKFNNSWNECWYWGGFNAVGNIAKTYVFDTSYLPAGTKLSFPIPVKTYQPQLFSSYILNTAIRPVNNTQGYIVGQRFIVGNSLTNTVLTFTADSNVKLPLNYAVSFYGQTWIGNLVKLNVRFVALNVNMTRMINQTYKAIMKFYISPKINRSILPTIKAVFKGSSTMFANRYITLYKGFWDLLNTWKDCQTWVDCEICKNQAPILLFKGSVYIQPNCGVSWWIRKMYTWEDCQTWN